LAVIAYKVWWGLCGMTKFYRSCAAFEHRGNAIRGTPSSSQTTIASRTGRATNFNASTGFISIIIENSILCSIKVLLARAARLTHGAKGTLRYQSLPAPPPISHDKRSHMLPPLPISGSFSPSGCHVDRKAARRMPLGGLRWSRPDWLPAGSCCDTLHD